MANTYKNIIITPNIGNTSDPKIQFSGGNTTANTDINLFVYPDSNGTLSFEGSAGQLFSITNDLSNNIFSINDISGIPSIEVFANGLISLAPLSGNVVVGNAAEFILASGAGLYANGTIGSAGDVLHSNGTSVYWAADDQGVTSVATGSGLSGGPITTTGTVSVLANTGIVANATGLYVNSTYIGTLTANNTSFVGTVSAANVVSNAQLSANLGNYQTTAGLSANVATLTANNTSFVGTVSAANVVSNAQLSANLSNYVTSTNLTNNLANYQTTAGLSANVATLTANNATNLGGVAAASYVQNTDSRTLSGNLVFSGANVTFSGNARLSGGLFANNSLGAAGQVLHSNGTTVYWDTDDQGVTSVASGNGLTGGPITSTGTLSVLANSGIVANSTGVFVNANTGILANSTGVFFNQTAQYTFTNTQTFSNTTTFGNSTVNVVANSTTVQTPVGFMNKKTLDFNYTYPNTYNTVIAGPFTVSSGITMTIESGARVSIV